MQRVSWKRSEEHPLHVEDPVSISEHQYQGILRVIECLGNGLDTRETRELAGVELLKLLRADYFASFIWNPNERRFADHVFINMDPQNLERYSSYYQFHNPLSSKVQKVRRAIRVNEILPQREARSRPSSTTTSWPAMACIMG